MAMGLGGSSRARGRGRGGSGRRAPMAEINVTPLVDVMLVLLIIFMISAPLLTTGVEVELPKTEASAVDVTEQPVTITIDRDGAIFVGEGAVDWNGLVARVAQEGGDGARDKPVFIRADGRAPYQAVARVMARLSGAGFTKLNLITDTSAAEGG